MGSADVGRLEVHQFSIVGEHAEGCRGVRHVGILNKSGDLEIGQSVNVFQMAPPLYVGQPLRERERAFGLDRMNANVLAWIDGLTEDQIQGIEEWIEETRVHLRSRTIAFEYTAYPAYVELPNEEGTMVRRRRYSCAGFVERCYAEGADIILVVEEALLPEVDLPLLRRLWGHLQPSTARLSSWGLRGSGPWRLLLPGYLLHAIGKGAREGLPYQPLLSDCDF